MKFTKAQIAFLKLLAYLSDCSEVECQRKELNIAKALKAKGYVEYIEPETNDEFFYAHLTEKGLFLFEGCMYENHTTTLYRTECGHFFERGQDFKFCPYCGKGLTEEKIRQISLI